jgi:DNA-binding GntR family transcriptional regulator
MSKHSDPTQTETIRRHLEEHIAGGIFQPGDRVDEETIANMFGTSRTPVREAVMQLVAAGLLEKQPRRGAVVAPLDIERMLQLFDFASELAGLCTKLATRRMLDSVRSVLEGLHGEMTSMAASEDYAGFTKTNAQFHLEIIRASGNDYLIEDTLNIASKLAPYFRYELTIPGKLPRHVAQHREILDAFATRNADGCAELMRRHAMLEPDIICDFLALQKAIRNQAPGSRPARKIDPVLGRELKAESMENGSASEAVIIAQQRLDHSIS